MVADRFNRGHLEQRLSVGKICVVELLHEFKRWRAALRRLDGHRDFKKRICGREEVELLLCQFPAVAREQNGITGADNAAKQFCASRNTAGCRISPLEKLEDPLPTWRPVRPPYPQALAR